MRPLAAFVLLGALCSGATGALAANAGAGTTMQVVPVQPIDVCDNTGANCASTAGLAAYETIANLIYQQAGIQFAFAPVTQYDNAQYLTDTVDTTGITVFDQAHDLVRLPGHGQSQYASALNVYFVNNLVSTTAGVVNPGTSTLGYGLVGGNGAVVATAPDASGRVAALDTLAHELGHNLGLTHVTDPLNVMDGTTRAPLVETCQITPYTCAAPPGSATGPVQTLAPAPVGARAILVGNGASPLLPGMIATGAGIPANDPVQRVVGKFAVLAAPLTGAVTPGQTISFAAPPQTDLLTPSQLATLSSPPIFTELPNVQSVIAHPGDCVLTTGSCSQLVTYTQTTPGQQPLTAVRYRFLDPSEQLTQVTDGAGNPLTAAVGATPIAGHVEFDIAAPPALLQPGGTATNQIAVGFNAPFQPVCPTPALGSCYDNVPPFSVEFDFANGVTSRAGFDSVTGTFTSETGQDVGFDPTNSNLTIGASILPQENVPTDLEYQTTTPAILESIVPPLEFPSADTSVPEPGTWGALGLGALATAFSSRSRRKFATQ